MLDNYHPSERPRVREQQRQGGPVELMAESYHVRRAEPKIPSRNGGLSASTHGVRRSKRGSNLSRHKSSDAVERAGKHDELGATTLHGKSSVSRIRKTKKKPEPAPSRRRNPIKRAMSTDNVAAPEESTIGRRGGRRNRQPVQQPKNVEEVSDDDSVNSSDDSFAADEESQPQRDLLTLLKDNATMEPSDFFRENRKVLHFLIYKHKLGLDAVSLQAKVDRDFANCGGRPIPRPALPLYVEAEM